MDQNINLDNYFELDREFLDALLKVTNSVNNSEDVKEDISNMLKAILRAVGSDFAAVFIKRSESDTFRFFEAHCLSLGNMLQDKKKVLSSIEFDGNNNITGADFGAGEIKYLKHSDKVPVLNSALAEKLDYDINNMLVVPLLRNNKVKGGVVICNKYIGGDEYTPNMIKFIQIASNHISLIISDYQIGRKMNSHNEQMNVLINSMELVNSNLSLTTVLDSLMQMVMKIINAEASSILLIDEEKQKLRFVAASGKKKEEIKNVTLSLDEGVAGWVATKGAPLLIPDVSYDKRFSFKADQQTGFVTKSILAVPLKLMDRVIGVVEAINKKNGGEFNNSDTRILMTFATTGAIGIQKARLYEDLNDLFMGTLRAIADAIEAKDPYTRGHSERIRRYSMMIAERMGLDETEKKNLSLTALLHDVGKIGVPEEVLVKKEELNIDEIAAIRRHPSIGADMLSSIRQLKPALPGIRHHQERFDGQGYPSGLVGEDIPLFGRIIAVVDTFDSMNSDRPYRKKLSVEIAIDELKRCSGSQFDPVCVDAFLDSYAEKTAS